jgi:broad specificity phosphatase PhoE
MSNTLPIHHLARHGETAWTITGQHTGRTDLPLTASGELNATRLGDRLRGVAHQEVWTSPLVRAHRTCDLAGLGEGVRIDADLLEWDYGDYEGLKSSEIHQRRPDWDIFRDGCPGGESPADVVARARRVVDRLRTVPGGVILFSSSHFLRVLAACWLGLDANGGRWWILGTASLSAVGYEHDETEPAIRLWNDRNHVVD